MFGLVWTKVEVCIEILKEISSEPFWKWKWFLHH